MPMDISFSSFVESKETLTNDTAISASSSVEVHRQKAESRAAQDSEDRPFRRNGMIPARSLRAVRALRLTKRSCPVGTEN